MDRRTFLAGLAAAATVAKSGYAASLPRLSGGWYWDDSPEAHAEFAKIVSAFDIPPGPILRLTGETVSLDAAIRTPAAGKVWISGCRFDFSCHGPYIVAESNDFWCVSDCEFRINYPFRLSEPAGRVVSNQFAPLARQHVEFDGGWS